MKNKHRTMLQHMGLSSAEAQVYLALFHNGPLAAAEIAQEAGMQRTGVYPALLSLTEKGLVEGATGYKSKFVAIAANEALGALIEREKKTLEERERLAQEL